MRTSSFRKVSVYLSAGLTAAALLNLYLGLTLPAHAKLFVVVFAILLEVALLSDGGATRDH